jgi:hypothetical protein
MVVFRYVYDLLSPSLFIYAAVLFKSTLDIKKPAPEMSIEGWFSIYLRKSYFKVSCLI